MDSQLLRSLMLSALIFSITSAERYSVPVQDITHEIIQEGGFDRIIVPGSHSYSEPGTPAMPSVSFCYLLAREQKLASIRIIDSKWEQLAGSYNIRPEQEHHAIGIGRTAADFDSAIYFSQEHLPARMITGMHSGNVRGYSIGQISICPFRYQPGSGRLFRLTYLEIEIETEDVAGKIEPIRHSQRAQSDIERFIASFIVNKSMLLSGDHRPSTYTTGYDHDEGITDLPSLIGAPVDLLIITTNDLQEAYLEYARTKKKQGYNTAVRTISWIRQHYQGVDDAERLRNFLCDGLVQWGVVFVLLGGDVPDIPTRWIWMAPLYDEWPPHVATDGYFSDLDGSWNADGDEKYGEVDDLLDLYPDVFVGRLPTRIPQDVRNYLAKVEVYLHPVLPVIHDRALFFTSDFNVPDDAYQMAMRLQTRFPSWFTIRVLNEKFRDEIADSIDAGFGLVMGLGHGDVNNIRNKNTPRQSMNNYFFDAFANNDKYALMVVITCFTNPFQSDCLSEHWLCNPEGGGIGYIGPSSSSEAYLHEEYTRVLFDSLFSAPVASALAKSKIPFVPQSLWDNWYRLYQFSINYLGDPCLTLWDSIPHVYTTVTVSPETLNIGLDSITIQIDPPVPSRVLFYKPGELYVWDTIPAGSITSAIFTESAGYLNIMIQDIPPSNRGRRYVTTMDSCYVTPSRPCIAYHHHVVHDTVHNADGQVNPGEDIYLAVYLTNNGGSVATDVQAQLICSDPLVDMITNVVSYPDIQPFQQATSLQPFFFKVSPLMPDEHSFEFQLNSSYSGTASSDSFQIVGAAPELHHFTHRIVTAGDTIAIAPFIQNQGHMIADSVHARVEALSDSVVLLDSIVIFPPLPPLEIIGSGDDSLKLYLTDGAAEVRYMFRLYCSNNLMDTTNVTLGAPAQPESLRAIAHARSIALEWKAVPSVAGYRVYRGTGPHDDLVFLNNDLLDISYYNDFAVQPGQDYYYTVIAVDSSMNEGTPADTIIARVNPIIKTGWPRPVYDYLFSSCNFGEIDLYYPGLEIVVCGKEGYVYAWHSDGTPVLETEVFYDIHPTEVWTSPAIGDANADSRNEIIFGVRRNSQNLYMLNDQGLCLPGWPITVPGYIIGSPVLSDLDADNDLEIVIWTLNADLYAFHHDGSGVFTVDGLVKNLPGVALGTPAVGDIDRDGDLEIVCCGGSGSDSLYVWDNSGAYFPPFPRMIQPEGLTYSVVLGDIIGDDRLEISFYADNFDRVYLVAADGSILWFKELQNVADVEGSPIFADVTGDGRPEIICGFQSGFTILDSLGNELTGFPDIRHDAKLPIVAAVHRDEVQAAVVGSANWRIYGYRNDGASAAGFPIQLGNRIESSPAVFDIDNDGLLELMYGGSDFDFLVHELETVDFEWPRFRYDQYNTGVYHSPHLPGIATMKEGFRTRNLLAAQPTVFYDVVSIAWQNMRSDLPLTIKIYNVLGQCVKDLSRPAAPASRANDSGNVQWHGKDEQDRDLAAGIYFVRLQQGDLGITKKIVRVR